MIFRTSSAQNLYILLLSVYYLTINVSSTPLVRRVDDGCGITNEASTLDGPTSDNSAGIGVEFECGALTFIPVDRSTCPQSDINPLKGNMLGGRAGANWVLTGDTTSTGSLSGEYILNGKTIKIGASAAGPAAAEVAADLVRYRLAFKLYDSLRFTL
jgi:hypothetical protein